MAIITAIGPVVFQSLVILELLLYQGYCSISFLSSLLDHAVLNRVKSTVFAAFNILYQLKGPSLFLSWFFGIHVKKMADNPFLF